jgi:transcription antitermination factor NusG
MVRSEEESNRTLITVLRFCATRRAASKRGVSGQWRGAICVLVGKAAIIKDHEIEALQNQLSHPDPVLEVVMTAWQPNAAVQIPDGPFKGQEAIVQNVSPTKVKLLIQSLNLYVTLERQAIP